MCCKEGDAAPQPAPAEPAPPAPPRVTAEAAAAWIKRVVEPQRLWFDAKAEKAKFWHVALTGTQLVGTASIPVVNSLTHSVGLSSILAGMAAIATGFGQFLRHHDHWLRYRAAAAALDGLQKRYEVGLPPFDGPDRHDLFVAEADRIMGEEGGKWLESARKKPAAARAAPPPGDDDDS
jgi:hypothetical protein